MKKRTVRKKDKYSVTEVGTLIERLRAEFKPVLKAIPGMQEKLDSIYEQVGRNTEKIELNRQLITRNEGLITRNEGLINRILEELKMKVDRKDFEILEKKVASLTP